MFLLTCRQAQIDKLLLPKHSKQLPVHSALNVLLVDNRLINTVKNSKEMQTKSGVLKSPETCETNMNDELRDL
jgi:hypothetical protein